MRRVFFCRGEGGRVEFSMWGGIWVTLPRRGTARLVKGAAITVGTISAISYYRYRAGKSSDLSDVTTSRYDLFR